MSFLRRILKKGKTSTGVFLLLSASLSLAPLSFFASPQNGPKKDPGENTLPDGDTPEAKFLNRLESLEGVDGSLDLSLSYPDRDKKSRSALSLEGASFAFVSKGETKAIHLDGSLSYNESTLPFLLHYADSEAYVSLLGARYRYATSEFDSLFDSLTSIFGTDFVNVPTSFYDPLKGILGAFGGANGEAPSLKLKEQNDQGFTFEMSVASLSSTPLTFRADASYNLLSFDAKDIAFQDCTLSVSFKEAAGDLSPLASIRAKTPKDPASYTPIIDSMGLVKRFADLAKEKQGTLTIKGDIDNQTSFPGKETLEESFDLSGTIAFDVAANLFHGDLVIGGTDFDESHGSTSLSFFNKVEKDKSWTSYLTYNNLLKVSMDSKTFNAMMALFEDELGENGALDRLTNVVREASAVKEMKNGRYGKLLNAILSLESGPDSLRASLSLKDFGMGENSTLDLTLLGEKKGLSTAIFKNIEMGKATVKTLSLSLGAYVEESFDTNDYYSLDGLPTLSSQMKSLFQEARAHLGFSMSVLDEKGLGYPSIAGETYFDLKKKAGSGDVTLYNKISDTIHKNNHVLFDVSGGEDTDEVRFHYFDGDSNNEGLRGKMAIKDINDIIDLAKGLYDDEDPRFAKFFDPIRLSMASSAVGALTSGRYGPFLASKLLLKASLEPDLSTFVFDGKGFGFKEGTSFTVILHYTDDRLVSLELHGIETAGKKIDGTITLIETSFGDEKLTPLDFTNKNYFQFDGINELASSALNESKRESFHLYSTPLTFNLSVIGINAITFNLQIHFYVYVKGEVVKVYGSVTNNDYTGAALNVSGFRRFKGGLGGTFDSKGKVTSYIFYDNIDVEASQKAGKDVALPDQKGHLYVKTDWSYYYWGTKRGTAEAKYDTDQLKESKTVVNLVFWDILALDMRSYYNDMTNKDPVATAYENALTSYSYDTSSGTPKWGMGMNLGVLANTDLLSKLSLTVNGSGDHYLSSLLIPTQSFLSIGGGAVKGDLGGTLYNEAPGKDYWNGDPSGQWSLFLTPERRARAVTQI